MMTAAAWQPPREFRIGRAPSAERADHRGLADLKRITPQVVAVQLNEVEGVEEYAVVSAVVTDEIERGNAVVRRVSVL